MTLMSVCESMGASTEWAGWACDHPGNNFNSL